MKISLPIKLGIAVIVIFGLLMLGMVLWKPVKVRYYTSRLQSDNIKVRQAYAKKLLEMGAREPVFRYYTDKYDPNSVEKRMAVVEELCKVGDKGKEVMKEIFRNWCYGQQVKIPAGSFMMGSEKGEDNEKPVHKVTLSSFWMDKYEVTNEKYYVFMKLTGRKAPIHIKNGKIREGCELHPVNYVTWDDAKAYADWLGMRLPYEAEWEYACRAGSKTEFCCGDDEGNLAEYGWYEDNSKWDLLPVGLKRPNKWSLFDMHGSLAEWCQDWYSKEYYRISPANNPRGPNTGKYHVIRGGSIMDIFYGLRSAWRIGFTEDGPLEVAGFRLSRSLSN